MIFYHQRAVKSTVLMEKLFAMSFVVGKREAGGSETDSKISAQRSIYTGSQIQRTTAAPIFHVPK
jgi:hypothetical protein